MIQSIIVLLIVGLAGMYLFRYFRNSSKRVEDSHGCPSCTLKKQKQSR